MAYVHTSRSKSRSKYGTDDEDDGKTPPASRSRSRSRPRGGEIETEPEFKHAATHMQDEWEDEPSELGTGNGRPPSANQTRSGILAANGSGGVSSATGGAHTKSQRRVSFSNEDQFVEPAQHTPSMISVSELGAPHSPYAPQQHHGTTKSGLHARRQDAEESHSYQQAPKRQPQPGSSHRGREERRASGRSSKHERNDYSDEEYESGRRSAQRGRPRDSQRHTTTSTSDPIALAMPPGSLRRDLADSPEGVSGVPSQPQSMRDARSQRRARRQRYEDGSESEVESAYDQEYSRSRARRHGSMERDRSDSRTKEAPAPNSRRDSQLRTQPKVAPLHITEREDFNESYDEFDLASQSRYGFDRPPRRQVVNEFAPAPHSQLAQSSDTRKTKVTDPFDSDSGDSVYDLEGVSVQNSAHNAPEQTTDESPSNPPGDIYEIVRPESTELPPVRGCLPTMGRCLDSGSTYIFRYLATLALPIVFSVFLVQEWKSTKSYYDENFASKVALGTMDWNPVCALSRSEMDLAFGSIAKIGDIRDTLLIVASVFAGLSLLIRAWERTTGRNHYGWHLLYECITHHLLAAGFVYCFVMPFISKSLLQRYASPTSDCAPNATLVKVRALVAEIPDFSIVGCIATIFSIAALFLVYRQVLQRWHCIEYYGPPLQYRVLVSRNGVPTTLEERVYKQPGLLKRDIKAGAGAGKGPGPHPKQRKSNARNSATNRAQRSRYAPGSNAARYASQSDYSQNHSDYDF